MYIDILQISIFDSTSNGKLIAFVFVALNSFFFNYGSPSSSSAKKGKLFKLIKWNAVAFRNSKNHIDGDCAICYSALNGLCTDCKVNDGHIKDCPLSQGNMFPCGHIFHSHCIEGWIKEKGTCTCPLDNKNGSSRITKDDPGKDVDDIN